MRLFSPHKYFVEYIINPYIRVHPQLAISFVRRYYKRSLRSVNFEVGKVPESFEDLLWLFSCSKTNRGVVRLDLNEAGHLFSLARSIPSAKILEIGRLAGGSTILLAAAIDERSKVTSIDINPKDDETLASVLNRVGLAGKVELIVDDANNIKAENESYDIIFIDGDHSYEGVSRDYNHWKYAVKKGGHMVFHDYDDSCPYVMRLCDEIMENDLGIYKKHAQSSSILDFIRV